MMLKVGEEIFGITDIEVLDIAKNEDRIILTLDKDYGELIFLHKADSPPAVIFYRYKGLGPQYARQILIDILKDNIADIQNKFTVVE